MLFVKVPTITKSYLAVFLAWQPDRRINPYLLLEFTVIFFGRYSLLDSLIQASTFYVIYDVFHCRTSNIQFSTAPYIWKLLSLYISCLMLCNLGIYSFIKPDLQIGAATQQKHGLRYAIKIIMFIKLMAQLIFWIFKNNCDFYINQDTVSPKARLIIFITRFNTMKQ